MNDVNSIRPPDGTSLRALCEVRSVARASVREVLRESEEGDRDRNRPRAIGSANTKRLTDGLGDEAKSRSFSKEHPLTGKPDAGDSPVRFGGTGGASRHSYPYLLHGYGFGQSMSRRCRASCVSAWRGYIAKRRGGSR